jgi:hypothetical protein
MTSSLFPSQYHFTNDPYSSSTACSSSPEGQTGKALKFLKSSALPGFGKHWAEKNFHIFKTGTDDTLQDFALRNISLFVSLLACSWNLKHA